MATSRRNQIKKHGDKYVLKSADGEKTLGTYSSLAAAEAGARRIYARHGRKGAKKASKVKEKRFVVVCEGASVSRAREANPTIVDGKKYQYADEAQGYRPAYSAGHKMFYAAQTDAEALEHKRQRDAERRRESAKYRKRSSRRRRPKRSARTGRFVRG
jgi:hypothetical protein